MSAVRFGTLTRDVCSVIGDHCNIQDLRALSLTCKGGHQFFGSRLTKMHAVMLLEQHILAGKADAAIKMVAAQPDLLLYRVPGKSHNAWQALVATRDIPLIYDLLMLLPRGAFNFLTKEGNKLRKALLASFVIPTGNIIDFIESCKPIIRTYDFITPAQRAKLGFKKMGPALANLPANVLQYYCRADKRLYESDFFEMTPPRELKYEDKHTNKICDVLPLEKSGIGTKYHLVTSSLFDVGYPQAESVITSIDRELACISKTLEEMDEIRTGQMLMLEEILKSKRLPLEKLKDKKAVYELLEKHRKLGNVPPKIITPYLPMK